MGERKCTAIVDTKDADNKNDAPKDGAALGSPPGP